MSAMIEAPYQHISLIKNFNLRSYRLQFENVDFNLKVMRRVKLSIINSLITIYVLEINKKQIQSLFWRILSYKFMISTRIIRFMR